MSSDKHENPLTALVSELDEYLPAVTQNQALCADGPTGPGTLKGFHAKAAQVFQLGVSVGWDKAFSGSEVRLELVTWADIRSGDLVWSMGSVHRIDGAPYVNEDDNFRPGLVRFRHVPAEADGITCGPPMELTHRVPRVIAA
jgi:hypothetical protein